MKNKRKICVVTGTRAEYGLLYWLLKELQNDSQIDLQLVVTGMHLSPEFGYTYKIIEEDGFLITRKLEILLSSDSGVGVAKAMGLSVLSFADCFEQLKPDLLVLLGDRFEILAAGQTALVLKIPMAHIFGGETTSAAFDDSIRHSLTKMAHLHFASTQKYKDRIIQLGEDPQKVFFEGAISLDNINRLAFLSQIDLSEELNFKVDKSTFLITYHSVTLDPDDGIQGFQELLNALELFEENTFLFTYSNADSGGRKIISLMNDFVSKHKNRAKAFFSLGQKKYMSCMKHCGVVIGNSSSGIIEAPAFELPTINIGNRQNGREKAPSIIDTEPKFSNITEAIKKACSPEFKKNLDATLSPYYSGNDFVSKKIKDIIVSHDLKNVLIKKFHDLN